ncbi:MAG: cytochrome c-type biogenesis protein CcmH [Dehalococcoidia bacterium]
MRYAPRSVARGVRLLIAAALAIGLLCGTGSMSRAQTDIDARALDIERQLLCPQCTNLRLDVCETQICIDMRSVIRERLEQGQSDTQIIDYFTGRYGDRVLADVPREGFNLWLFAWVGGSMAMVALVGGYVLLRLRRTAVAPEAIDAADERWLDEHLRHDLGRDS